MARAEMEKYDMEEQTEQRGDFLEYLRDKQKKDDQKMTDLDLMSHLVVNM